MPRGITLGELLAKNTMEAAPELVVDEGEGVVQCLACANRCHISDGETGICRMRINRDGKLQVPANYVAGLQVDPIEKKPFYHVLPGRDALSFGMLGCNLHCDFCQNWISSQALKDDTAGVTPHSVTADELVQAGLTQAAPVMVSTYNEPLITADWSVEVFKRAKKEGLTCGFVSNGNATPEVLEFIRPYVDLYKVDLKCFDDAHYRQLGCPLDNVLTTIRSLVEMGFWVELVTLVVPDFNDSDEELRSIAQFIAEVSPEIPWHVTAFHPDYHMPNTRRTTASDLERACAAGKEAGLQFVYAGNLAGVGEYENTTCPGCGAVLVRRMGHRILDNRLWHGQCPECNYAVPGFWERPEGG